MEPETIERLLAETRRHFDVASEAVRADVRLVAEGMTAVRTELQQLRREVADEFTELRSMIRLS